MQKSLHPRLSVSIGSLKAKAWHVRPQVPSRSGPFRGLGTAGKALGRATAWPRHSDASFPAARSWRLRPLARGFDARRHALSVARASWRRDEQPAFWHTFGDRAVSDSILLRSRNQHIDAR